jgi:hypothetical protein
MSEELVKLFEKKRHKMERAFRKTSLSKQGWELEHVSRIQLEQRELLARREKHANGAQWIFWAEEPA